MCIVSGHVPVGHVSTDDRISCNSSGQSNGSHAIEFGKDYWFSPLLLIPTFTVFGNLLVCLSVWRDRNLQTVTNYFIVSLAVADIMVAILVMPFAVYVEINKNVWELGDPLCDTWVAFDVLCCTASILNLTAISVDRFIAVTQPIRYSRHRHNHRRVYVTLGLTWVISVTVSLPIAVGMNYTERRRETPWLCTFYNSDFLIYSSMLSFYIPCLLMIFLYFKTFRAIRQVALKKKQRLQKQERLCKRKMHKNAEKVALASRLSEGTTDSDLDGASDCGSQKNLMPTRIRKKFAQLRASGGGGTLRKKASESEISSTHSPLMDETELELINRGGMRRVPGNECTCLTTGKGDHVLYESTTPRILEVSEELNPTAGSELQSESKTAGDDGQHVPRTGEDGRLVPLSNFSVVVRLNGENDTASSCRSELRKNRRFSRVVSLSPPPRLSERGSRRGFTTRERKATKTLAIVLGVFLFCWVPFFTINIVNAICIRYGLFDHAFCNIHQMAFSCFVWLGYFNSFLNPVIYTIFNEEFRKAFKAILLVPCK